MPVASIQILAILPIGDNCDAILRPGCPVQPIRQEQPAHGTARAIGKPCARSTVFPQGWRIDRPVSLCVPCLIGCRAGSAASTRVADATASAACRRRSPNQAANQMGGTCRGGVSFSARHRPALRGISGGMSKIRGGPTTYSIDWPKTEPRECLAGTLVAILLCWLISLAHRPAWFDAGSLSFRQFRRSV
jgi:hypothetical protein